MRYRQFVAVVDRFPRSSIIVLKDFRNALKGMLFLEIYSFVCSTDHIEVLQSIGTITICVHVCAYVITAWLSSSAHIVK